MAQAQQQTSRVWELNREEELRFEVERDQVTLKVDPQIQTIKINRVLCQQMTMDQQTTPILLWTHPFHMNMWVAVD